VHDLGNLKTIEKGVVSQNSRAVKEDAEAKKTDELMEEKKFPKSG